MNDQEFLHALESGTLPHHDFPHRAHLRMAWLYLNQCEWDEAASRIRTTIQRFAAAHGATRKYHETITRFWAIMVRQAIACTPGGADFETFIAANPDLLDAHLTATYYSSSVLFSESARQTWIDADLKALPVDCENSEKSV